MKEYIKTDEWKAFMPKDDVKPLFEKKVLAAKPPK